MFTNFLRKCLLYSVSLLMASATGTIIPPYAGSTNNGDHSASSATTVIVNNNCDPRWTWLESKKLIRTACSVAIVQSTVYQMTVAAHIWCTCNGTRAWTVKASEYCNCVRRSHIIGKRFGGPKWSVNCWCNPSDTEQRYTDLESLIADQLDKHQRQPVEFTAAFDGVFLYYNISQSTANWMENNSNDLFEGRKPDDVTNIWRRMSQFREILLSVLNDRSI